LRLAWGVLLSHLKALDLQTASVESEVRIDRAVEHRMLFESDFEKEDAVNWEQTKGQWNQAKGAVKKQWGKLTDDDLAVIAGQRDQLVGKIQERYGIAKEEADKQVKTWESMKVNESEDVGSEQRRKAS
jgi:uncharacterized protein YjbJ (UPF0337 family)